MGGEDVGPPAWGGDPSHLAALHERSHGEHITLVCNKNRGLKSLCLTQSLGQRPLGACFPHGCVHSYLSVYEPAKPLVSVMQSHRFQQCWLVGQCCCLGRRGIWGKSSRKEVSGASPLHRCSKPPEAVSLLPSLLRAIYSSNGDALCMASTTDGLESKGSLQRQCFNDDELLASALLTPDRWREGEKPNRCHPPVESTWLCQVFLSS